jgi:hypothetical protein
MIKDKEWQKIINQCYNLIKEGKITEDEIMELYGAYKDEEKL